MKNKLNNWFDNFASKASAVLGSSWVFILAVLLVLSWLASGPFFHFSTAWNFAANSATTVITFIMIFVIQNAQNREMKAIHLKLDELIRAVDKAHNELIEAEQRDTQWLEEHRITKVQQELNSHE